MPCPLGLPDHQQNVNETHLDSFLSANALDNKPGVRATNAILG